MGVNKLSNLTLGIVGPGDMGHSVARVLTNLGYRVVTVLDGRSELSHIRAKRSNMRNVSDLKKLVSVSDFIFSIMPPNAAWSFAKKVSEAMGVVDKFPIFVDCNAISPKTTLSIDELIKNAGANFLNVGIIGPSPGRGMKTKFYASGEDVNALQFLNQNEIELVPVGEDISKASAIKMCYAALTKGTMTLQASVLIAAELLGVSSEVQNEFQDSQKFQWEAMNKRVSSLACDASRWASEMDQISETFGSVGVTENLHKGAADIFRLLEASPLSAETRETYDISRTMRQSINMYAKTALELRNIKKVIK